VNQLRYLTNLSQFTKRSRLG